ncbi:bile acid:sodium symporter family protein [Geofilum rubicundum]|uniref:Na(+) dependent transporter,Sodium Bile acid symporter family n=1 Tax=Geofilum rubicundum JCM 15548 TaxID=1236989 RepID=A0A0E9LX23_9BACT|nr:bile acid:sodium symporter family protein [Geofilum rubicundum]GAO29804.1 Na(+) dependent transporter,Sodium Bile acid symporter family [Geofilum rubicundum JCM 15548]
MKVLDNIVLNFSQEGLLALNIVIALVMFGVALDIKWQHFIDIVRSPKAVIAGALSQFILLPAVTFLLILAVNPTPTVALGMILVASCPGGNISNFMSSLAKGNTALSVSLTAVSTSAALIMTPLNFTLWGQLYLSYTAASDAYLVPIEIELMQVVQTVVLLLGIPVLAGLLFNEYLPKITKKITQPFRKISILIFITYVVVLLSANFDHFIRHIHLIFLIVLIHNALALGTGFSVASVFRLSRTDRRSVTIETGIQNSGLALVLIFNPKIFPPELQLGGMAFIAAWWGVWHIVSGLLLSSLWSRKSLNKPVVQ